MQTFNPATVAATVQGHSAWLKNAARVAFLLFVVKGSVWLASAWLALRGFESL